MAIENENIRNIFFESIISFNKNPIFGKNSSEIITQGIEVFKRIPNVCCASLFLLEESDFDFYYKTSTSLIKENEIKNIYSALVNDGGITAALNTGELTGWKLSTEGLEQYYQLIIPLLTQTGIIGLILLVLEQEIQDKNILDLCQVHANYFAVLLSNEDLVREIENLKESTEQKIAFKTKDIVQSTRELKAILDSVQIGIMIVDKKNDQVADLNLAAANLIGSSKEKIIGTPKKDLFFFAEKRTTVNEILTDQEGLLKKSNGKLVPVIITVASITLGIHEFFIESFVDISERKYMEEALQVAHYQLERRVEERTRELKKANEKLQIEIRERVKAEGQLLKLYWAVEQSPTCIFITDLQGIIEYVNPKFLDVTGYKYEEAVGKTPNILKSDENSAELYKGIWESITSGIEWKGEYINRKKNGELYWVFSSISPIRNVNGDITHFLSVQEDVTERKIFEKELLVAKEKAEQSDKLKSTLLANMSHEFRTPLIGILGFSQILDGIIEGSEERNMIRNIQLSGKRLLNTLNGVLTLSQLEANEISLNITDADIVGLTELSFNSFIKNAESKGLKFTFDVKSKPVYSGVDSMLFREALNNLIDNAIKFTDKGSIIVRIDSVIKDGSAWAVIKIEDTGIGILNSYKQVIFEAFRQASEGYNRNFEGCGLGLTLSKKMFEIFGGSINLESEHGKGSVFEVWLPAIEKNKITTSSEVKSAASHNQTNAKDSESPSNSRILLVEDNLMNQDVIATFLKEKYNVDCASNGNEAFERVTQSMYDLILMDINLGAGINGLEVAQKIRELNDYEKTPIIAVTGYAMFGDKEKFLDQGLTDYLAKPFDDNQLLELISRYL